MFDPLRTDASRAGDAESDPDRDAKIEQLLLDGLDRYFAAQYDEAINVWTRALFLDRNHARARAYIERARRALAERQRESEELLQSGVAAFSRGEREEARRLLRDAIGRGAPPDEALAVLGRLDRIDQGAIRPDMPAARIEAPRPAQLQAPRRPPKASRPMLAVLVTALAVAAGCAWLFLASGLDWQVFFGMTADAPPQFAPNVREFEPGLPLRGEMALARARMLAGAGRLHDAIAALETVRPTDFHRGEADRFRADLQQQLIALTMSKEAASGTTGRNEGSVP
jgi:hypothetical protein